MKSPLALNTTAERESRSIVRHITMIINDNMSVTISRSLPSVHV